MHTQTHKGYTYFIIYSTGPQPPGSNDWWSGADIIIKIKCTINLICLIHLKIIPPQPSPWKNCPPCKQSLVPKRLGIVGQRITFKHLNLQILKIWEILRIFQPKILFRYIRSDQISRSVVSDSLRPHESQHARPPCLSPTPGVHWDSRPSSQWCHPAISSSVVPFSSCPQSLPASESFPMSQLFAWGGQSTGVSALDI